MKSNTLIKFGEIVRKKRQERGLSQEDFAELVGVHRTYVGMIERAEKNITLLNIEKIAQAFGISMSELLENL
jgi:transcriptional regulator with XRE-family HTH domain